MKAIQTEYKGYLFRSRLEARWAVFFDACGVRWEYEPEGYDLGDGLLYLPDFLLHDVTFNHGWYREGMDLYVEVKGSMTEDDTKKIIRFAFANGDEDLERMNPLLVLGNIPEGETMREIEDAVFDARSMMGIDPFNFETVDGDNFGALPGVGKDGKFQLFGADSSYTWDMDTRKTERAYRLARQSRFEHGAKPGVRRY